MDEIPGLTEEEHELSAEEIEVLPLERRLHICQQWIEYCGVNFRKLDMENNAEMAELAARALGEALGRLRTN